MRARSASRAHLGWTRAARSRGSSAAGTRSRERRVRAGRSRSLPSREHEKAGRAARLVATRGATRAYSPSAPLRRLAFRRRPVHELDQRHRRVVALPEAELEDAQVATRTRLVARPELVEELGHDLAIAQAIEGETAVRERRLLAEGDERLGNAAQFLRLRQRGLDDLVREQRIGHVAQHSETMTAGAIELAQAVAVTHVLFPERFVMGGRARLAASSRASCRARGRARRALP